MTHVAETFRVPDHRLAAMSLIQMLVSRGYYWWHTGSVRADKVLGLMAKFCSLYPSILTSPNQRATAKRRRIANVQLVLFPDITRPGNLVWYLLATAGKPLPETDHRAPEFPDLIHQRERMKDARRVPLWWHDHYLLHQRTIVPDRGKKRPPRTVWTWSIHPDQMVGWRDRIQQAAVLGEAPLVEVFSLLRMSPMFSGIRSDVMDLSRRARDIWKKNHRKSHCPNLMENPLPYTQREPIFRRGHTVASVVALILADTAEDTPTGMPGNETPTTAEACHPLSQDPPS